MKSIYFLIFFVSLSAYSRDPSPISFGLLGGLNFSLPSTSEVSADASGKLGFEVGARARFTTNSEFTFFVGADFRRINMETDIGIATTDTTVDYFRLSGGADFNIDQFILSPGLGFNLPFSTDTDSCTASSCTSSSDTDDLESFLDIEIAAGTIFELDTTHFIPQVYFSYGLGDLNSTGDLSASVVGIRFHALF